MRLGLAVMLLMSAVAVGQAPTKGTIQMILDPVQARYPGNEWVKPCGPDNHNAVCFDPNMLHVTNSLYSKKENCEKRETVKCSQIGEYWAPIGKPVLQCVPDGLACNVPVEMLFKHAPCQYPFAGEGCAPMDEWNNRCVSWSNERGYFPVDCAVPTPAHETTPADITALMEAIAPTEPKPTVEVEPITRSVLHCPDGWRVEVWHKTYCPNCATFSVTSPLIVPQGHPAEYHPYFPPTPLMAADDDTDSEHPPRCEKEKAK